MYVGRVEKLLAHYSQIPLCFVNRLFRWHGSAEREDHAGEQ